MPYSVSSGIANVRTVRPRFGKRIEYYGSQTSWFRNFQGRSIEDDLRLLPTVGDYDCTFQL